MENINMGSKIEAKIKKEKEELLSFWPKNKEFLEENKEKIEELESKYKILSDMEHISNGHPFVSIGHPHTSIGHSSDSIGHEVVYFDKYKKSFYISGKEVTLGSLTSLNNWGKEFNFDKSVFEKKNGKDLYEEYLIFLYKKDFLELLNEFIFDNKIPNATNLQIKDAYIALREKQKKEGTEEQLGFLAEKMISSFLERISFDRPDLHFKLIKSNVFQDIEGKIDFILQVKNEKRGVKTETLENFENEESEYFTKKIQFTIKNDLSLKEKQLSKLKDVILISIPEDYIKNALNLYQEKGGSLKTPEFFLSRSAKILIIKNLLEGLIRENELKSLEKNINDDII